MSYLILKLDKRKVLLHTSPMSSHDHRQLLETTITFTRHSYAELGRLLGVSRQRVSQYKSANYIPEKHWKTIQLITGGKRNTKGNVIGGRVTYNQLSKAA